MIGWGSCPAPLGRDPESASCKSLLVALGAGAPRGRRLKLAHLAANLADGLLLQLTDALARQVVLVADFLQRELVLVVEAEAPPDDARLDGRERSEQAAH